MLIQQLLIILVIDGNGNGNDYDDSNTDNNNCTIIVILTMKITFTLKKKSKWLQRARLSHSFITDKILINIESGIYIYEINLSVRPSSILRNKDILKGKKLERKTERKKEGKER